jgi:hypothetical protein
MTCHPTSNFEIGVLCILIDASLFDRSIRSDEFACLG